MTRAILFILAFAASGASAQAQTADIPRTRDGHPDFQGVWDSLWLTPLERPADVPGDIPANDVERVRQQFLTREAGRAKDQLGTDGEIAIAAKIMSVGGVYRGSQVIDPADGRIPRSEAGKSRLPGKANSDGPESFTLGVRCVSGVNTGPMRTANFDMLHRIVQTPDSVVIYSESMGDTRILPIVAALPANWPRTMTGSSAAHWESDTLVVETSRFDGSKAIGSGPTNVPLGDKAVLVERFNLNGPDELVIRYTVTDPENYTQPWAGEIAWVRSRERLFETVCHEGNHSLTNMLMGARVEEERAAKKRGP
ncbi:MAG: hypothetical protein ABMA14_02160 [Hyphomonadaceae bacterium]